MNKPEFLTGEGLPFLEWYRTGNNYLADIAHVANFYSEPFESSMVIRPDEPKDITIPFETSTDRELAIHHGKEWKGLMRVEGYTIEMFSNVVIFHSPDGQRYERVVKTINDFLVECNKLGIKVNWI